MSESTKQLTARQLVDLSPYLADCAAPVAISVGWDRAVYAAAGQTTEPLREDRGRGVFPKSMLDQGTRYRVLAWKDGEHRSVSLGEEATVASYVQPTPGGFVLAGARCYWREDGPEKNAVELDWDGTVIRRFTVGDGIADLRTTPRGAIWAAYFDEGIFGNYGWNSPGPRCLGASGCVCFDPNGTRTFEYSADDANTDFICDTYAMNVANDDDVWLYFYTEFPIVHVADGAYTAWEYGTAGARAIAVDGQRALLFGDYDQRNLARIVTLGRDGRAVVSSEFPVVDEDGVALVDARARGIGSDLYLFRGSEVLVLDPW